MTKTLTLDTNLRCEITGTVYEVVSASYHDNGWVNVRTRDAKVLAFHKDTKTMTPVD